jgi:hypothetical protein
MEELKIDKSYDNKLKELEFYKNSRIHQLMLPYIGFNYQEHKVLLVAESHYLGNDEDRKKVANFKEWYEDKGDIILSQEGHIDTRGVVEQWFSSGNGLFQKIKKELDNANIDIKYFWERIAFMNFFIVPSTNGSREIYSTKEVEEKSLTNFEEVIKILKPNYILFLSKRSYYIFEKNNSEYLNKTFPFSHPTSIWWYRKRKDGKRAKGEFKEKIEIIFKS